MKKKSPERTSIDSSEEIILAALRLLNRLGYGSTTMAAIAKEARMTKQRVMYHFKSPHELLSILARRWGESGSQVTLEQLAASHASGADRILDVAKGLFLWMKREPELSRFTLVLFQVSPEFPDLSEQQEATLKTGLDRIFGFLRVDPRFSSSTDGQLKSLAQALHASILGSAFYVLATHQFNRLSFYDQSCQRSLRLLMGAFERGRAGKK